jgi:hypothetical protein
MGEYWLKGKKSSRFPTIPTHGIDEPHISIFVYFFILYSHYLVGNYQVLKLLTPILCEGEEHPRICKRQVDESLHYCSAVNSKQENKPQGG